MSGPPCLTFQAITASRTTPTLCVLVIITGPLRKPESSTQVVPVISPLPLRVNQAAKTASLLALPRGWMAVTPVRTGPLPTTSLPSPEVRVECSGATLTLGLRENEKYKGCGAAAGALVAQANSRFLARFQRARNDNLYLAVTRSE